MKRMDAIAASSIAAAEQRPEFARPATAHILTRDVSASPFPAD